MILKINFLLAFAGFLSVVSCNEPEHNATNSKVEKSPAAHKKSREIRSYVGMISCAMKFDSVCFLNVAEDFLADKKDELLAQADAEALRATGRSDDESKPSQLASTLSNLVSQITNLFQSGFGDFFKEGKEIADDTTDEEGDDDDDEEEESAAEEHKKNDTARSSTGEARGKKKKKKKKLESMLKLFGFLALIYKKVSLLLKIFHAALQFKFYLIALGGLLLHAAKFWISFKKDHSPSKVIYYEHAQHQHHYGHGEELDWGRAFGDEDQDQPLYVNEDKLVDRTREEAYAQYSTSKGNKDDSNSKRYDREGDAQGAELAYFAHRPGYYVMEYSPADNFL